MGKNSSSKKDIGLDPACLKPIATRIYDMALNCAVTYFNYLVKLWKRCWEA